MRIACSILIAALIAWLNPAAVRRIVDAVVAVQGLLADMRLH